ncbi:MAG: hypothetical protein ACRD0Q_11930 [Acidimicrobiales bacterium]
MTRMARRIPVASVVVGVVAAHAADYALVHPQSSERAHQLSATGHGYWHAAVAAALVAAGALLLLALVEGARRGLCGGARHPGHGRLVTRVATLAGCQVGLFCIVELVERAAAGVDPTTLLRQPELVLGIVLQVVVAAVMTLLLDGVERVAGDATVLRAVSRRRQPSRCWERPAPEAARHRVARRSLGARAPPQLAA